MEIGIIIAIIGILVAIVIAYLTIVYPIRYSKKMNVCFLKSNDADNVQKFIDLYCEKIADEQRIPPDHLKKSLALKSSATTIKDFKKKVNGNFKTVHLPLFVKSQGEIIGLLKAIYVKDLEYVFIAYLISKQFNNFEPTRITTSLLNKLYHSIEGIEKIKFITFEIVEESNNKHIAKERLFKHITRAKYLIAKCINASYLIPEVCSFDSGVCDTYKSKLYYIDLKEDVTFLHKNRYYSILNSIYDNIYTESYRVTEPRLVRQHINFTKKIMQQIKKDVSSKTKINLT